MSRIGENAPQFCLALLETYSWPCETSNMKCFAKIINDWIQSKMFAEGSILDVSLGFRYVFDYPEAFSIIINWCFHFESSINFSNLISILLKYLEQKLSRYVQQSYVWNLSKLHHEEQEMLLRSEYDFFIDNLEHVQSWVGYFY